MQQPLVYKEKNVLISMATPFDQSVKFKAKYIIFDKESKLLQLVAQGKQEGFSDHIYTECSKSNELNGMKRHHNVVCESRNFRIEFIGCNFTAMLTRDHKDFIHNIFCFDYRNDSVNWHRRPSYFKLNKQLF